MSTAHFLGIDVNEAGVRAGVVDVHGSVRSVADSPVHVWRNASGRSEQSGEEIWSACCRSALSAIESAGIDAAGIAGVGFCAVGSMVALDRSGEGVAVGETGRDDLNVIAASDMRALNESQEIRLTLHEVLRCCGAPTDATMQVPRLLWLKRNDPGSWRRIAGFFDLADFLVYRATGETARSLSTVTSRWTYDPSHGAGGNGWVPNFFQQIGLGDLARDGFDRLGREVRAPGQPAGSGASVSAARQLGVQPGTPVSIGIDRVLASGLGLVGARPADHRPSNTDFCRRLMVSNDPSLNHVTLSGWRRFVGPARGFHSATVIPGLWFPEGSQMVSDRVCRSRAQFLNHLDRDECWDELSPDGEIPRGSSANWHRSSWREFDRHPISLEDPSIFANACWNSSTELSSLKRLVATECRSIAREVCSALRRFNRVGSRIDTLVVDGRIRNRVLLSELGGASGCRVVSALESETAILGSAMLATVASRHHPSVSAAVDEMGSGATIVRSKAESGVARTPRLKDKVARAGERRIAAVS